ncbi:hypothetical protein CALCODRAFT_510818 [Calocera cornea HHB12733]|uniref:NAA35-like N-terminal domain-containing protein n=1 Tax=Calocera cornea HHB12733 TaxID=1353952 RepID=A0A165E8S4_9BASI|nr:hypothetical protein CALCODRAFT_510818 [Calocera cornea HHB12733]
MDSGFGNGNLADTTAFDVHSRLLPDEVCWLLDQTFAAEMAWHQGITLTQTVFTILYGVEARDPGRPVQLINIVLAAGVLGMTKCVDLAWREFAKGCVYEHEDWQADKAGVVMMEHVSKVVHDKLYWSAYNFARLKFTSPLEAISLPDMPETWDFFDELLAGLGDACDISEKRSPLNWEAEAFTKVLRLRTSINKQLDPEWLVDTVLQELAGLPIGTTTRLLNVTASSELAAAAQQCILKAAELLLNYYTTLCHNRPRQRRIYSNALPHWRDLLVIAKDVESRFHLALPDLTGLLSSNPTRFLLSQERQHYNMERRFKWALPENGIEDDLQPDWSGNSRWIKEHESGDCHGQA